MALPGMEAYLDVEELVFSSPISIRRDNTPTPNPPPALPLNRLRTPNNLATSKLWDLGKQTQDDERVFKFDEEQKSPMKQPISRGEIREKKPSVHSFKSRWDSSSSESEDSPDISEDEREEDKENKTHNIVGLKTHKLDFLEIEQKLSKMKLDREVASYTRLVVVVDTNCLMDARQREAVLGLKHYKQLLVIVPFIVWEELDKIKTGDGNKAYDARRAIQFLSTELASERLWLRGQRHDELPLNASKFLRTNDEQVLKCCLYFQELAIEEEPGNSPHDVLLITMDRILQVKAKTFNVSSLDCATLAAKLTDSWHETTRVATNIYFKDGKLCASPYQAPPPRLTQAAPAQARHAQSAARSEVHCGNARNIPQPKRLFMR